MATGSKAKRLPPEDDLKEALRPRRLQEPRADAKARTVELKKKGMLLDLGGIGKGYAADEALKVLREAWPARALVAAGGDIVAGDPPPDAPGWTVGITPLEDPDASRRGSCCW